MLQGRNFTLPITNGNFQLSTLLLKDFPSFLFLLIKVVQGANFCLCSPYRFLHTGKDQFYFCVGIAVGKLPFVSVVIA
jgi:hypothetical protein